ncbi:MAG: YceI family protein [Flavobacteriales bacterium]|nr:YceI family protein [Flavobacteriales bacterium]
MKKLILFSLYISIISFGISQDFKINSSESIVEFNYLSEEAVGTIKGVSGTIHFDVNNLSESYFETKVNISSINTSNKTRDKHLKAPDYFHTEKYPHIIFKSESLKMDESEFVLVGKLTIKEISKNEEIRFAYKENVFEGRCVIYSNDYEIKKQKTRQDSKILIKITVPVL